jgi:prefoldin subunit 5
METITSSAGQVVETYKQILDKLEVELDKCEAENHKLLSRIATLEKAAKSLKGERRDGTN